jgi:hypothetical protein
MITTHIDLLPDITLESAEIRKALKSASGSMEVKP